MNGTVNESAARAGAVSIFSGVGTRGTAGEMRVPVAVLGGVTLGFAQRGSPIGPTDAAFVPGTWSGGFEPQKAVDETVVTRYANLAGRNTGLVFAAGDLNGFNQITFHTYGNALDSDPTAFALYGLFSPAPDGYYGGLQQAWMVSSAAPLTTGTIALPAVGRGTVTVNVPRISLAYYCLLFTDLRGPDKSTMQIADISFQRTRARWGSPGISRSNSTISLNALGLETVRYTLWGKIGLKDGKWDPLGGAAAQAGGAIQFSDTYLPSRGPAGMFYRIEEEGISPAR